MPVSNPDANSVVGIGACEINCGGPQHSQIERTSHIQLTHSVGCGMFPSFPFHFSVVCFHPSISFPLDFSVTQPLALPAAGGGYGGATVCRGVAALCHAADGAHAPTEGRWSDWCARHWCWAFLSDLWGLLKGYNTGGFLICWVCDVCVWEGHYMSIVCLPLQPMPDKYDQVCWLLASICSFSMGPIPTGELTSCLIGGNRSFRWPATAGTRKSLLFGATFWSLPDWAHFRTTWVRRGLAVLFWNGTVRFRTVKCEP